MSEAKRDAKGLFLPGTPKISPGRAKGTLNKSTLEIKQAIEQVFEGMGGIDALLKWAVENQSVFYTQIWCKLLPASLKVDANVGDFTGILEQARQRVVGSASIKLNEDNRH